MKRYFLILLSVVLVVFSITSTSFATNLDRSSQNRDVVESGTVVDQIVNLTNQFEEVEAIDEKVLLDNLHQDIEQGKIILNSEADLDFEKISVFKETSTGDFTIRVPLVHENYEVISGITVVYDSNKSFQYFLETIMYEENEMGNLKVWKNNTLEQSHSMEISELEEGLDENALAHQGWQCINKCLSDQGLPMWALGLVGVVCAAACVGTAGAGCAICIQGLGLGFAGIFDYCLNVKCR